MIPEDYYDDLRISVDNDENMDLEIFPDLQSNSKLGIFFILHLDKFYKTFVDENQAFKCKVSNGSGSGGPSLLSFPHP